MNKDIEFSVTVPAYKAQFLAECIDSVLAQTYNNFELIIVNDASPQDLDSIMANYDDPRIRYYKNKVGFGAENVVGNWNKCLEYSTGDYIICMGDDDRLLPNCLEEYAMMINKYPQLGVFHAWSEIIDEENHISRVLDPLPAWESVYSLIYYRLSGRIQFIGDFLFDVKLLRNQGGFYHLPFAWGSDNMTVFIAAINSGIAHSQHPLFQYRSNRHSISSSSHNKDKMETVKVQYDWITNFMNDKRVKIDEISELLREQIIKQLPDFLKEQAKYYMLLDMKSSNLVTSIVYWVKNRQRYNCQTTTIIKNAIKSICIK